MCQKGNSGGDNTIAPQHPSRRTQREMEDRGVGCQELLVARSNKESGEVCGWMRHIPKIQELK